MIISDSKVLKFLDSMPKLKKKNQKTMRKASLGKRITRAEDDAAGLAISENMKSQIRVLSQGERNIQDGISLLQVTDKALEGIESDLKRMNDLAIQCANDTLTSSDRKMSEEEFDQLKEGIQGIIEKSEFNSIKLLKEDRVITIQTRDNPVTTYDINLTDIKKHLQIDKISVLSREDASQAISKIKEDFNFILNERLEMGEHMNNLTHAKNYNSNAESNTTSAQSRIEDLDMAMNAMDYVKERVLVSLGDNLFSYVKVNNNSAIEVLNKGI